MIQRATRLKRIAVTILLSVAGTLCLAPSAEAAMGYYDGTIYKSMSTCNARGALLQNVVRHIDQYVCVVGTNSSGQTGVMLEICRNFDPNPQFNCQFNGGWVARKR